MSHLQRISKPSSKTRPRHTALGPAYQSRPRNIFIYYRPKLATDAIDVKPQGYSDRERSASTISSSSSSNVDYGPYLQFASPPWEDSTPEVKREEEPVPLRDKDRATPGRRGHEDDEDLDYDRPNDEVDHDLEVHNADKQLLTSTSYSDTELASLLPKGARLIVLSYNPPHLNSRSGPGDTHAMNERSAVTLASLDHAQSKRPTTLVNPTAFGPPRPHGIWARRSRVAKVRTNVCPSDSLLGEDDAQPSRDIRMSLPFILNKPDSLLLLPQSPASGSLLRMPISKAGGVPNGGDLDSVSLDSEFNFSQAHRGRSSSSSVPCDLLLPEKPSGIDISAGSPTVLSEGKGKLSGKARKTTFFDNRRALGQPLKIFEIPVRFNSKPIDHADNTPTIEGPCEYCGSQIICADLRTHTKKVHPEKFQSFMQARWANIGPSGSHNQSKPEGVFPKSASDNDISLSGIRALSSLNSKKRAPKPQKSPTRSNRNET